MPSQSKSQQRFFGVVKAMQKGDIPKKGKAGKIAKTMDKDDVDDFASTKHKGLPNKVKKEMKVRELIKRLVREIMTEENLTEAISGADRKILFILVREIVRNLKSKIKNFDVNNKSHLNRVGSSILAIIRAMTYSPDNVNYKNFKKYFPKNFNSKLIQKKLKQFHSQNDKVQVTLVTQAIKNELSEGKLNEAPSKPEVGDYFEWDSWLKLGKIIKIDSKLIYVKPLKGTFGKAVVSVQYKIKNIKLFGQHKGKKLWSPK